MNRTTEQPAVLNLHRNEGPPPPVRWSGVPDLNEYPDPTKLQGAIASKLGCDLAEVVVTAGADDAIDRVMRAFAGPGRRVLVPDPTFEMTTTYATISGADVVRVPWRDAFPLDEFLSLDADVLVLVSPDNPTGRTIAPSVVEQIARERPDAIVMLDEAYFEYGPADLMGLGRRFGNVVVVRTFSKAWGLAGMRVGYAVCEPDIAHRLRSVGGPYPVSSAAITAATECLRNPAYVVDHVDQVRAERAVICETLDELGAQATVSEANFVFARVPDARFAVAALEALGVRIRGFSRAGLRDAIRVGCPGDPRALRTLRTALRTVLAPEALLFDMDGVLADVRQSYRAAIVATCAEFGVRVSTDDIVAEKRKADANDDFEVTRRLLEARGERVPIAEVETRFQARYDEGLWRNEPLLLSPDVLRSLAERHRLGVVTGRPRGDAQRFLRANQLEDIFDAVVCREDGPLKPSPAPVYKALQALDCTTGWMFGDTVDDVRAACDAGLLSIGVAAPGEFTEATREVLENSGALTTLRNVGEVVQWLR